MKMWLIVYKDGTFMTWKAGKPKKRDYQEGTKCYRVIPTTTLMQVSDWVAHNMSEIDWCFQVKSW